jgi:hypothetical protein
LREHQADPRSNNLPEPVANLLKDEPVQNVYSATLGSGTSFVVAYSSKDGSEYISKSANTSHRGSVDSRQESSRIPEELRKFLYMKNSAGVAVRDFPTTKVSLGPYNESFFACDKASARWRNVPATLQEAIKERLNADGSWRVAPRTVSLGVDNNFIMTTEGGGYASYLPQYPSLDVLMDYVVETKAQAGIEAIQTIWLSPYRRNCYIMHFGNGGLFHGGFPPTFDGLLESVESTIKKDSGAAS